MNDATKDFFNLIEKSKKILIFLPQNFSLDHWSAACALNHFLSDKDSSLTLFQSENSPFAKFLPFTEKIISHLNGLRDFLLVFNTEKNKIAQVKTKEEKHQLTIVITPKKGRISPRDFSFQAANFRYDLLITLGCSSLEDLGETYQKNTDLFFEVPKINIDYNSNNEEYGQVNLIDLSASSVCETLAKTILTKRKELSQKTAHAFLTGIVAKTQSFQTPTTTPAVLSLAALLINFGAKQSEIIRHLYKNKSLPFLKLWGKVMSHLEYNKEKKSVYSFLNNDDLLHSKASPQQIPEVIDEIRRKFSQGKNFGIFYVNRIGQTKAVFHIDNQSDIQKIAKELSGKIVGSKIIINFKNKTFPQAEQQLIKKLPILPNTP